MLMYIEEFGRWGVGGGSEGWEVGDLCVGNAILFDTIKHHSSPSCYMLCVCKLSYLLDY